MIKIIATPPLNEVRAKLREAGGAFPKELQKVNKKIAKEVAEDTAQAYSRRYRRKSGHGEDSIRALATQTKAQVAIGGARAPYVPGQNFGSNRLKKFAPKASPDKFLYHTVEARQTWIAAQHADMVDDLMREAFPDG